MTREIIIIALIVALIYLYYQKKKTKPNLLGDSSELAEIKSKLGEKSLDELIEENEDYETEVDTLTRAKNSLEKDLEAQSKAFQSRLREKDREVKKLKEDLNSEKQQHKGTLGRITKLTEQITNLEKEKKELEKQLKKIPGDFPTENKES